MQGARGERLYLEEKRVRRLAWKACYNVRDLGGYETADGRRIRCRALPRADDLCRLTPEGQQALVPHWLAHLAPQTVRSGERI